MRPPERPNAPPAKSAREAALDAFSEATTATDLLIEPPEYLREIHNTLERAERSYAAGDREEAARVAVEGLAAIRIAIPKLGADAVPDYYAALFHCFCIQPQYRAALALYKGELLRHERQVGGRGGNGHAGEGNGEDALRRAWQILEPAVRPLPVDVAAELLVYDFPVAGRVLRGVTRLRDQLRARAGAPCG